MVLCPDSKLINITFEELEEALTQDPKFRASVIRSLVKNHEREFLSYVKLVPRDVRKD